MVKLFGLDAKLDNYKGAFCTELSLGWYKISIAAFKSSIIFPKNSNVKLFKILNQSVLKRFTYHNELITEHLLLNEYKTNCIINKSINIPGFNIKNVYFIDTNHFDSELEETIALLVLELKPDKDTINGRLLFNVLSSYHYYKRSLLFKPIINKQNIIGWSWVYNPGIIEKITAVLPGILITSFEFVLLLGIFYLFTFN